MPSKFFKVLITCPPMLQAIERYRSPLADAGFEVTCPNMTQALTEEELVQQIGQYDGWIIGDDPATARVFAAGVQGRLRAAVKWGVGVDNVDFDGAEAAGVPITHTPGMFSDEVADIAMSYVVALARQTMAVNRGVWDGDWPKPAGMSLKGKIVALVGYGNIGQATARRLLAARMKLRVYDPVVSDIGNSSDVTLCTWPEKIDEADFVVLCCSLTESTRHMLNADIFQRCKDALRIVNVSRGPLIDERALCDALRSGKVHSAALEVFEHEPLPTSSPLRDFSQCIFGSHNASNTKEAVDRTSHKAVELLSAALQNPTWR